MASYPDATTTGVSAGVTLTSSGGMKITQAGTVINAMDIKGTVDIEANNVTIENSKIASSGSAVIQIGAGVTGTVVKDNDINGMSAGNIGINGGGTFVGNNIHNVSDGMSIESTNSTLIQDNYIHDMTGPASSHYDGIQVEGNASNIKIEHNTIVNENDQTSAVMICPDFGPTTNVTVDNNIMVGGGFTIYAARTTSQAAVSNITITNNHMGEGQYGYTDFNNTTPTYTGNVNDGNSLVGSLNSTSSRTAPDASSTGTSGSGSTTTTGSGTTTSGSGTTTSGSGTTTSGSGTTTSGSGTTTSGSGTTTSGSGTTTSGSGTTTTTGSGSGSTATSGSDSSGHHQQWSGHGTSGDDYIKDTAGRTVMTGQGGNDHFVFSSISNMGSTAQTRDVITDFASGDKIDLSHLDANTTKSGNQAFSFEPGDNQAFTHTAGQLAWRTEGNQTIIQGDRNGDGVHDFEIQLTGAHHLAASDFIL